MRWESAAVAALLFGTLCVAIPSAIFRASSENEVQVPLDVLDDVDAGLRALGRPGPPGLQRVAFLGDSMIVSYPEGQTVPERLQTALDRLGDAPRFRVETVAAPGMGPFDFFFIADRVAGLRPDRVILPINLTAFTQGWRHTFSRPQLAALLPPRRLPETLLLPLDWIGMTADRLLSYFAIGQLGLVEAWHDFSVAQARVGSARSQVENWIGRTLGDSDEEAFAMYAFREFQRRFDIGKTKRMTPVGIEDRYGIVLRGLSADDPSLEALSAALRIFSDAGIDVLVYTTPTNVEHFERVGSANPEGLARSIALVERTVTDAGAHFLDLHDIVGDSGFRDGAGHLNIKDSGLDGAQVLVDALVPPLLGQPLERTERD